MVEEKKRLYFIDECRGFWIINMIVYHAVWDLVYIYQVDWNWFQSEYALLWERMIAGSFIFIAGFCWQLSKKNLQRGLLVYGAGALVSVVTLVFLPDSRIIFGVLTFLGSAMLLMIPLDLLFKKINSILGMMVSLLLFVFMFPVSRGYLGFGANRFVELPDDWYCNFFSTYLGFTEAGFFSTDYFPIFPWLFLFIAGYFAYRFVFLENRKIGKKIGTVLGKSIFRPFGVIGRNALIIYMLHQPVIYGFLYIIYNFKSFA